jgi:DNA (cytosine-5)-methyltransferase 1
MTTDQLAIDLHAELIVDNFAGGGGASTGIELALNRSPDIAINHNEEALAMHQANHPQTRHYQESVWTVDIKGVCAGRRVGLLWLSPDCKHFSKAKGGKPREKTIRGLAWVALKWVMIHRHEHGVGPRVLMLENVEEFQTWGPLSTEGQLHKGCEGQTFRSFIGALRRRGYAVDYRELRACDFGAPTIRKRFFLIARNDGRPIVWPEATHGPGRAKPYRTAAECIDWSIPCPSIFERARPLAPATCRRIAKGIMRYVVEAKEPFIVPLTHQGGDRTHSIKEPMRTVTGAHRGEMSLVCTKADKLSGYNDETDQWETTCNCGHKFTATLSTACPKCGGYGGCTNGDPVIIAPVLTEHANASHPRCMPANEPLRTICAQTKGGHHALVNAFLTKFRTGSTGQPMSDPMCTVTANSYVKRPGGAAPIGLVTAHMCKLRGSNVGSSMQDPVHTISAQGQHHAEVRAFLVKYYGSDQDPRMEEPMHTVTARDRFGLVQVQGETYQIADIGLRMLAPRELFRAQGFPPSYIIDWGYFRDAKTGLLVRRPLTKTAQVRMCGNSVCPDLAAALARANCSDMAAMVGRECKEAVA